MSLNHDIKDGTYLDVLQAPSLLQRLRYTREMSVVLSTPLSDEDQMVQSMNDASPTKWHLAHTTWFFETFILSKFLENYICFDDTFGYCFNSYYDAVGPRHPRPIRGLLTRPSMQEVRSYRAYVDEALELLFQQYDGQGGELPTKASRLIELGIHHEQQHQELLLTDILHLFSLNPLNPVYKKEISINRNKHKKVLDYDWQDCDGGVFEIGHTGDGFCYDHEGPVHKCYIHPFAMANRLVTNKEWIDFINDGGYQNVALWLSDGWNKVQSEQWNAPLYWQQDEDGQWMRMSLHGRHSVVLAEPVSHISYYEAVAFANWAGKRLPTEQEWERAAQHQDISVNTFDLQHLSPQPAQLVSGLTQLFGHTWQWTQSAYAPYPGYAPEQGAVGEYNGKFMCNQYVLRGGSCLTQNGHSRITYRNFFYPEQRWQCTGLRLATNA
ncbi:MAG: ergothioneine biosynthesis protein EgtB [Pseudomonadota bacterium]